MTTLMLEDYEQTLRSDPGNLVFLELAELLIEAGRHERALEVCQQGLQFHPTSAHAYLLCAKAHLALSDPEAMRACLQAAVPLAANDGELLHRLSHSGDGLSLIALLEREVTRVPIGVVAGREVAPPALEPTLVEAIARAEHADRVQPAEQTALTDVAAIPVDPFAQLATTDVEHASVSEAEPESPTMVEIEAYVPADVPEHSAASASEVPAPVSPFDRVVEGVESDQTNVPTMVDVAAYPEPAAPVSSVDSAAPPAASDAALLDLPALDELPDLFDEDQRDLSAIFRSLDSDEPAPEAPRGDVVSEPGLLTSLLSSPDGVRRTSSEGIRASKGWLTPEDAAALAERKTAPAPICARPVAMDSAGTRTEAALGEFIEDVSPPPPELIDLQDASQDASIEEAEETHASLTLTPPPLPPKAPAGLGSTSTPAPPPLPSVGQRPSGLFADLPEEAILSAPPRPAHMPSVVVATETAEEIAREYERELRAKLLTQPPPSFLQRHWIKLAAAVVIALVSVVGSLIYRNISKETQGERVEQWRTQAWRALPLATPQAYRDAIELSERLLEEYPTDAEAQIIRAFAGAALFHRFGGRAEDRALVEALPEATAAGVPGLALAIAYRLEGNDGEPPKPAKSKALARLAKLDLSKLGAGFERAEAHLLLAQRAIGQKKLDAASDHLKRSLTEDPSHVETLLALGDNLLTPNLADQRAEPEQAYDMFDRARQVSPEHVGALTGLLQAALARTDQTTESDQRHLDLLHRARELYEAAARSPNAAWPAALVSALDLVEGQLRTRLGQTKEAIALLTRGEASSSERTAIEFQIALAQAHMRAGDYGAAAERLARLTKRSPQARLLHVRALIALGQAQEALKIAEASKGVRDLAILKGIALYELNRPQKAYEALLATAPAGQNMPLQAAIYLALIDAETAPADKLERSLELLSGIKPNNRWWPLAQWAKGRLLSKQGKLDEARAALLAAAAKDPLDFESLCLLGRLEAKAGNAEKARDHLERALERNGSHLEAERALTQLTQAARSPVQGTPFAVTNKAKAKPKPKPAPANRAGKSAKSSSQGSKKSLPSKRSK
ncbi:MAG: tetratricopeptide repeat protein [Myxococcales bacterium]|jgi:predicted Zn-dependent protease|nr:tetratricopeptide repeat protein [Myxococcales bacterium]